MTSWSAADLAEEIEAGTEQVFVLTNSRSKHEEEVRQLYTQIGKEISALAATSGRKIIPITRGDSTLRGHYIAEIEALAQGLGAEADICLVIPAFFEGGRYTYHGTHYYRDGEYMVPVGQSSYAQDPAFGYTQSHLREWLIEKSEGKIEADEVIHISIEAVRTLGPIALAEQLIDSGKSWGIIDALAYEDLEVISMACCYLEQNHQSYAIRTAASLLPSLIGRDPARPIGKSNIAPTSGKGGLVIVGSVVPKTTAQLKYLIGQATDYLALEISVEALLDDPATVISSLAEAADQGLQQNKLVILYTSRKWITSADFQANLSRNQRISSLLSQLLSEISVRPHFMIAKGGITALDLAAQGLRIKRAWLEGPLMPGIPLWRADEHSTWPHLPYLVFPGNVGSESDLWEAVQLLSPPSTPSL